MGNSKIQKIKTIKWIRGYGVRFLVAKSFQIDAGLMLTVEPEKITISKQEFYFEENQLHVL